MATFLTSRIFVTEFFCCEILLSEILLSEFLQVAIRFGNLQEDVLAIAVITRGRIVKHKKYFYAKYMDPTMYGPNAQRNEESTK